MKQIPSTNPITACLRVRSFIILLIALMIPAVNAEVTPFTPGGPTVVSVNFQGRIAPGPTSTDPLAPTDVAGVVVVGNWNNVPDADVTNPASCYDGSPTGPLVDS